MPRIVSKVGCVSRRNAAATTTVIVVRSMGKMGCSPRTSIGENSTSACNHVKVWA